MDVDPAPDPDPVQATHPPLLSTADPQQLADICRGLVMMDVRCEGCGWVLGGAY